MAYITAKDLRAVVPDEYRDAALSDSGSSPEPGLLQAVIDAACEEVDSLIEGRVKLPLSEPYPKKVKTAALYIALSILFARRGVEMPKDMSATISFWRTRMGKIGAGEMRLVASPDEVPAATSEGAIVTLPNLTGVGGLISALLFLFSIFCPQARAVDARTFSFTAPTNPMIESPEFMEWSQAESVALRYSLPAADATREARWEISDPTNLWLNMAPVRSGAVWSWNPAPTQTCLFPGRYVGRVAVYERTGTNLTFHRILAWQDIRVHAARDPLTLVMASPLASVTSGIQIAESDALGLAAAATVQSNLEDHASAANPHAAAGYLTAETDAASLEALGAHEGETNPHAITPAMIGALTVEEDPAFEAWEPAANVPVVCAGGWLYPDYFTLRTFPYAETGVSYGSTSEYNSVFYAWQTVTPTKGEVLEPEIVHQLDWTSAVTYAAAEGLEIVPGVDGISYAEWADGTASGSVGRVTVTMGDFSRVVELVYPGSGIARSNAWWVADVPGSLRAAVNAAVSNLAWASGKEAAIYLAGAYSATNFVRNTNCWVAGLDLTCASPWNSDWNNYKAGTLITPQHFLYAAHFPAPTNTTFRWIDATNGIHDRTLTAQRFLGNDIALGLLDSPLPDSIAPAKTITEDALGRLRGKFGLKNGPGIRVLYLDGIEKAWQASSTFMENSDSLTFGEAFFVVGSTNLPFSRYGAVGGDSGNPIFLTEGTTAILISTFTSPCSGPMLPAFRTQIEDAMVEMGGSSYTNWAAADLSSWTNYDAGAELPDY